MLHVFQFAPAILRFPHWKLQWFLSPEFARMIPLYEKMILMPPAFSDSSRIVLNRDDHFCLLQKCPRSPSILLSSFALHLLPAEQKQQSLCQRDQRFLLLIALLQLSPQINNQK